MNCEYFWWYLNIILGHPVGSFPSCGTFKPVDVRTENVFCNFNIFDGDRTVIYITSCYDGFIAIYMGREVLEKRRNVEQNVDILKRGR